MAKTTLTDREINDLIMKHMPMAEKAAHRVFNKFNEVVPYPDLLSHACEGLWKGIVGVPDFIDNKLAWYWRCAYLRAVAGGMEVIKYRKHIVFRQAREYVNNCGKAWTILDSLAAPPECDEESAADRERGALALRVGLAYLPDRERKMLRLRYVEECTQREIAAQLGVSHQAISQRFEILHEQLSGLMIAYSAATYAGTPIVLPEYDALWKQAG